MDANLTPYQFERLIELLDKEYKKTDSAFYCGLRNNLQSQYNEGIEKQKTILEQFISLKL
jgi:hypothetical protein